MSYGDQVSYPVLEESVASDWIFARLNEAPSALEAALNTPLPSLSELKGLTWDVVGVGGSEGPARLMVQSLNQIVPRARLVSISHFATSPQLTRPQVGLVVFSQGLSPHARLALSAADHYAAVIVITSRDELSVRAVVPQAAQDRLICVSHPPVQEAGSLLRVVGPACSALLGARLASHLRYGDRSLAFDEALAEIPNLYRKEAETTLETVCNRFDVVDPVYCLALCCDLPAAHQMMWKWQEALCVPLPPALDAMAFAHGPFQSIFERKAVFLSLENQSCEARPIWSRLKSILNPERHVVVPLSSRHTFPVSFFDFDAQLLPVLARVACGRAVRLSDWPGKNLDRPLYALDPAELASA